MGMKYTDKEVEDIILSHGYRMVSQYMRENKNKGGRKRRVVIEKDGYLFDTVLSRLNISYPEIFDVRNPYTLQNISKWMADNKKPFSIIEETTYLGNDEELILYCFKCKRRFDSTWSGICSGSGCPFCSGKRILENETSFGPIGNLTILKTSLRMNLDYK